jgi:hypothetical protein
MTAPKMFTAVDAAERIGLKVQSLRVYKSLGIFPTPDGRSGSQDVWKARTLDTWRRARRPVGRPAKVNA